jgi:hypothetical protein
MNQYTFAAAGINAPRLQSTLIASGLPLCSGVIPGVQSLSESIVVTAAQELTSDQQTAVQTAIASEATQFTADTRSAAAALMLHGDEPVHFASRAADSTAFTLVNNVSEGFAAALQLIAQRAGVAVPTAAEIEAQIVANRAGQTIDPQAPTPADVAAQIGVRLGPAPIIGMIAAAIGLGAGDPIPSP